MATLVLSAVGTAVAGPFGSALGGLIGRQVDQSVFGGGASEGPRLTELAITTSSYGQAIPRRFGRMRVAGTIIWATDLAEQSNREGGKGQPSRTTYSYTVSLAVAVSSTPIAGLGRIWADGRLLRGAGGDMKVGGKLRIYTGYGDDLADPLIEAEQDEATPGFRDCAYLVFEDLQLEEFGNRIPALTFEVFASPNDEVSLSQVVPQNSSIKSDAVLKHAKGYTDPGGAVLSTLKEIDRIYPLTAVSHDKGISIVARDALPETTPLLSEELADGRESGPTLWNRGGGEASGGKSLALRYYDENLDYQPSVQRSLGRRSNSSETVIELPATLSADGAKQILSSKANRFRWLQETVIWLTSELNPSAMPGATVKLPNHSGKWHVLAWEWFEKGIEYTLQRAAPDIRHTTGGNSGQALVATDEALTPTILDLIEAPQDGISAPSKPAIYAVATSEGSAWRGASLHLVQGESLIPIGPTNRDRAVSGILAQEITASRAMMFEPQSHIDVQLPANDLSFNGTDMDGLASGANRLLVGAEIIQFACALPLENNRWRLSGLLRGRGGTEDYARLGHLKGTSVILLDDRITPLDPDQIPNVKGTKIAAIAVADIDPVVANIKNAGLSTRPITPVHPNSSKKSDGSVDYCWTRRARGTWRWEDGNGTPLIEEEELYLIGYGPVDAPYRTWQSTQNSFSMSSELADQLRSSHGPNNLWVKQIGTHSTSRALSLAALS